MLEQTLTDVYTKFKLHFYQEVFNSIHARETSLSTVETFSVEVIHALNYPTINEFSNFINVSSPNAAYKVNQLIKKGYIEKVQSKDDKREYHLKVTQRFFDYYNMSQNYVSEVVKRVQETFSKDDIEKLDALLGRIRDELMPEVNIPPLDLGECGDESDGK